MIETTFAVRLKEAREARGMSLGDLAAKIDTSRQVLSKYELGKLFPRVETLANLASTLEVPPSFFAQTPTEAQLNPLFFRNFKSKTAQKQRTAAERRLAWVHRLIAKIEDFVDLPPVNVPDFKPPSNPLEISDAEVERAASELRRFWGLKDGVIPDVIKLVENNGCIVTANLIDSQSMDGLSQWGSHGRPLIAIDCRDVSSAHRRLDVAHELGHLIVHRHVDKRYIVENPDTHRKIEEQAFRFAGAFMLPEGTFRQSLPYVSLDSLLLLKPQWRLSVSAMLYRAQNLRMISDETAKRLWINLNRRGWKKHEPLEDRIALEEPRILANAIIALRSNNVDDALGQICRDAGLLTVEISRYVGLPEWEMGVEEIPDFAVAVKYGTDLKAIK
jgi:Zn-dependent peptidase ImmA (M78 family)/transcriptional regulator with XRE-family HTH domain